MNFAPHLGVVLVGLTLNLLLALRSEVVRSWTYIKPRQCFEPRGLYG